MLWIVGFYSHLKEEVFATISVELKKEGSCASRANTAMETLGNTLQTKEFKTSGTRHCIWRNTHNLPQIIILEQ